MYCVFSAVLFLIRDKLTFTYCHIVIGYTQLMSMVVLCMIYIFCPFLQTFLHIIILTNKYITNRYMEIDFFIS
jgi:hypothetical protein